MTSRNNTTTLPLARQRIPSRYPSDYYGGVILINIRCRLENKLLVGGVGCGLGRDDFVFPRVTDQLHRARVSARARRRRIGEAQEKITR